MHNPWENHSYYKTKEKEIEQVSKLYNFDSLHNLRLKTTLVDEYNMSEHEKISNIINEVKPNIIYLPFKSDVHSDMKIFETTYSCTDLLDTHLSKKYI